MLLLHPLTGSAAWPPEALQSRLLWFFTLMGDAASHPLPVDRDYRVNPVIPMDLPAPRYELQKAYQLHAPAVFRLAMTLLRNQAAAEDLSHDVFLRFWTAGRFDPLRGSVQSYLLTLTLYTGSLGATQTGHASCSVGVISLIAGQRRRTAPTQRAAAAIQSPWEISPPHNSKCLSLAMSRVSHQVQLSALVCPWERSKPMPVVAY